MTSRERIEAALNHREPDRTPWFEYVLLPPVSEQILGRPLAEYMGGSGTAWPRQVEALGWEGAVRQYARDRLDLAARLGHDMLYVCPSPVPQTSPPAEPAPEPPLPDDPVARVDLSNQRAAEQPTTLPDEPFLIYSVLREEMAARDLDLPLLAPAYGHGVWTNVDLMQTMLLDPLVAHRHFELATQGSLRLVARYVALGVEQIGVGGDFAGNRPLISPQSYREFIMPEVRKLSRAIHAAGGYAVNASDGDLWSVIEDFLLGCEVDGYLEIDQQAGMDLRRLKAAYGEQITFYGNLYCGKLLSFGTPAEIRAAVLDCLEAGQGRGGHIFCVSNAITASVPPENYLSLVHAYRDSVGLPRLTV